MNPPPFPHSLPCDSATLACDVHAMKGRGMGKRYSRCMSEACRMPLYECICACVCVCVCVSVCLSVSVCVYVCMFVSMYVCKYACVPACV